MTMFSNELLFSFRSSTKRELGITISFMDVTYSSSHVCGSKIATINESGIYDFFCPRTKTEGIIIEDNEMAPGQDTDNNDVIMFLWEVEIFGFFEFGKSLKLRE